MKYGDSLTSNEALARLEECENKKKSTKPKQPKATTKPTNADDKEASTSCETTIQDSTQDIAIEKDPYYAVMFTKPAAYYIARALNKSPPEYEGERYVMKSLNRGPNNTYNLPLREKVEDVERKSILCQAKLEGAGPFYLKNNKEVESTYRRKLKEMKEREKEKENNM